MAFGIGVIEDGSQAGVVDDDGPGIGVAGVSILAARAEMCGTCGI